ncbi:DUF4852 domain-containing protein [Leadbetterella byssophila]|nr:DUF4852 domain-containing protein [Leadbetterella byssophila]
MYYLKDFLGDKAQSYSQFNDSYYKQYCEIFHTKEFNKSMNEFDRQEFRAKMQERMRDGIRAVINREQFYYLREARLSEYNFGAQLFSFPGSALPYFKYFFYASDGGVRIRLNTVNENKFNFVLRMTPEKAREYLTKHPNRTVYLLQTYSFLDEKQQTGTWTNENVRNKTVYVTLNSVLVFSDKSRRNLIASFEPANQD